VDTFVLNDKAWIAPGNFPHTEKLRMIHTIRRPDLGHLEWKLPTKIRERYEPWRVRQVGRSRSG